MEIRDPKAMRALAHPLRLRLLEVVAMEHTATATRCSELVGESPANCSFHLRTLEKYGYLERVPGRTARDRPYRVVDVRQNWSSDSDDPDTSAAADALGSAFLDWELARIRAVAHADKPAGWEGATYTGGATLWLTPEELRSIRQGYVDLIAPYVERLSDPTLRPEGGRPVRLFATANLIPDPDPS